MVWFRGSPCWMGLTERAGEVTGLAYGPLGAALHDEVARNPRRSGYGRSAPRSVYRPSRRTDGETGRVSGRPGIPGRRIDRWFSSRRRRRGRSVLTSLGPAHNAGTAGWRDIRRGVGAPPPIRPRPGIRRAGRTRRHASGRGAGRLRARVRWPGRAAPTTRLDRRSNGPRSSRSPGPRGSAHQKSRRVGSWVHRSRLSRRPARDRCHPIFSAPQSSRIVFTNAFSSGQARAATSRSLSLRILAASRVLCRRVQSSPSGRPR